MMTVEIDPAIQTEPDLYSSIRRAHQAFDAHFGRGPSFDSVSAVWKFGRDDGEKGCVRLEMKDDIDHAEGEFPVDQLWDSRQVRTRLIWVLSDLLQNRSRRLQKEFEAVESTSGGA